MPMKRLITMPLASLLCCITLATVNGCVAGADAENEPTQAVEEKTGTAAEALVSFRQTCGGGYPNLEIYATYETTYCNGFRYLDHYTHWDEVQTYPVYYKCWAESGEYTDYCSAGCHSAGDHSYCN